MLPGISAGGGGFSSHSTSAATATGTASYNLQGLGAITFGSKPSWSQYTPLIITALIVMSVLALTNRKG